MIITEQYEINGRSFTRTYSDSHRHVVRDGIEYAEANDPTEFNRTYTEGSLIEEEATDTDRLNELQQIMDVLLGENQ